MKKSILTKVFIGLFAIALITTLSVGLSACGNAQAQQQRGNTNVAERWEYKIFSSVGYRDGEFVLSRDIGVEDSWQKTNFNALGRDGWKYAGSFGRDNNRLIFKRRLP